MNDRFEDFEENEDEEDFDEEDYLTAVPAEMINKWKEAELDIHEDEINLAIMEQTIRILENSWWWKFMTTNQKVKRLTQTYQALSHMIDQNAIYSV